MVLAGTTDFGFDGGWGFGWSLGSACDSGSGCGLGLGSGSGVGRGSGFGCGAGSGLGSGNAEAIGSGVAAGSGATGDWAGASRDGTSTVAASGSAVLAMSLSFVLLQAATISRSAHAPFPAVALFSPW